MVDFTIRKQILWESFTAEIKEVNNVEVELIRKHQSNNPEIGSNIWSKFSLSTPISLYSTTANKPPRKLLKALLSCLMENSIFE